MKIIKFLILTLFLSTLTTLSFALEKDQEPDSTIFSVSDTLVTAPVFTYKNEPSGIESIYEFYRDSLRYPKTQDCSGRVYIKFVIEKDASLTNLSIIRDIPGCNEYNQEALRLIQSMNGLWKPAIKDKKNVRCFGVIAVRFDL